MTNNVLTVVKKIPKWRIILIVIVSLGLARVTFGFFNHFINYLFTSSVTLSSLKIALIDIIGHGKYDTYLDYLITFNRGSFLFLFVLYIFLFYRRETNKQFQHDLRQMIKETEYIAAGNLNYQMKDQYSNNNLEILTTNINNIVQRLKQAIEEERLIEHTKTELIANVSHDLRTPLTSVVGYLRIIEQDKYRDEVALRHYTGIAYEKAISLEKLINELFEYTRMQDHKYPFSAEPINIAEILGQLVVQYELNFDENGIICRDTMSSGKLYVLGDGERLARVFGNLIDNAIRFGRYGEYVDILAHEKNEWIEVIITNYGDPIPSIDLPHIFERFYRVEKSRSENSGGAGLGLAISKSIIMRHNGIIEVKSDHEKTSFIVKLHKMK